MSIAAILVSIIFLPIGLLFFFGGLVSLFRHPGTEREKFFDWPLMTGTILGIRHPTRRRKLDSQIHHHEHGYYYYAISFRDAYGRDAVGHSQHFVGERLFQDGQSVAMYVGQELNNPAYQMATQVANAMGKALIQTVAGVDWQPDPRPAYEVRLWSEEVRAAEKKNSGSKNLAWFFIIFGAAWLAICLSLMFC